MEMGGYRDGRQLTQAVTLSVAARYRDEQVMGIWGGEHQNFGKGKGPTSGSGRVAPKVSRCQCVPDGRRNQVRGDFFLPTQKNMGLSLFGRGGKGKLEGEKTGERSAVALFMPG